MNESAATDEDLTRVVEAAMAAAAAPVPHKLTRIPIGDSNIVVRADDPAGRSYAVRLARHTPDRLELERSAMAAAAGAGVPVPAVRYAGTVVVDDAVESVLVSDWVDGRRLRDLGPAKLRRPGLIDHIAAVLAAVHSVPVKGYGNLDGDLDSRWTSFDSWFVDGGLRHLAHSRELAAGHAGMATLLDEAAQRLRAERHRLAIDRRSLAHGDFSPANILVRGAKVVAVLDWESAKGGHPALDFGWWDFVGGGDLVPTGELVRAYRHAAGTDIGDLGDLDALRALVRIRVLGGHLAWCVRTGTAAPVKEISARLAAELHETASSPAPPPGA
jgi:aminoglycoside phosphotransferase (APT) family kinase protein